MDEAYTLKDLISKMRSDVFGKWHNEGRSGNDGSAGNTLEDLLGVSENNLKTPDWGEIELKTKSNKSQSLVTLLHREPSPNASVPSLLRSLGWRHQKAGGDYSSDEMSFRSTTRANSFSDRGFAIKLHGNRVDFVFEPSEVSVAKLDKTKAYNTYGDWLADVHSRDLSYKDIFPVYWERDYLENEIVKKLNNTLFVTHEKRIVDGVKSFKFNTAVLFKEFDSSKIDELFENHALYVDFDARTRHNHGTKFRIDIKNISSLFRRSEIIY